jgi:hypothetical protein
MPGQLSNNVITLEFRLNGRNSVDAVVQLDDVGIGVSVLKDTSEDPYDSAVLF